MNTFDYILAQEVVVDEGFELNSYQDHKGYWTIGVGHLLGKDNSFSHISWTPAQIMITFMQDLNAAIYHSNKQIKVFDQLSINRQRVIINMMFNLGPYKFDGFKDTKRYIEQFNYKSAYKEMLNSKWAKIDVPKRAARLAERWLAG